MEDYEKIFNTSIVVYNIWVLYNYFVKHIFKVTFPFKIKTRIIFGGNLFFVR